MELIQIEPLATSGEASPSPIVDSLRKGAARPIAVSVAAPPLTQRSEGRGRRLINLERRVRFNKDERRPL